MAWTWWKADWRSAREQVLALAWAWVLFFVSVILIWSRSSGPTGTQLLATGSLGISIAIAARLSARRTRVFVALAAAGLLLLAAFFLSQWQKPEFWPRLLHLGVLTHLWVALSPALRDRFRDPQVTWRTNWVLMTRSLVVGVQSGVLLAGLLLALNSLELLFGIPVDSRWNATLIAFVAYVVTCFLLTGSLSRIDRQESQHPEFLRLMIRNVYTPLSLLYFVILYAYAGKIAVLREWPKGGVGWLVGGLSVMVTMTSLIKKPFEKTDGGLPAWVRRFWSYSFAALLPLLGLLLGALRERVLDYGWTEARVLLLALTLWMIGICLYYIRPEKRSLHAIPTSLLILGIVLWIGPLSLQSVSVRSQLSQLRELARAQGIAAGAPLVFEKQPSFRDRKRLSQILNYFCVYHGAAGLARALGIPQDQIGHEGNLQSRYERCSAQAPSMLETALRKTRLQYVESWDQEDQSAGRDLHWSESLPASDNSFEMQGVRVCTVRLDYPEQAVALCRGLRFEMKSPARIEWSGPVQGAADLSPWVALWDEAGPSSLSGPAPVLRSADGRLELQPTWLQASSQESRVELRRVLFRAALRVKSGVSP